jgi:hypothetical protein
MLLHDTTSQQAVCTITTKKYAYSSFVPNDDVVLDQEK